MADPLAIVGVVTGSLGTAIALRREYYVHRRALGISHGIHFQMSRAERGQILNGWALVNLWNKGGRQLAVERVAFEYHRTWQEGDELHVEPGWRAEIGLEGEAITLAPDTPSVKIYTPLAGLTRVGLDPELPINAWATTSGGREWRGDMYPVLQVPPPGVTADRLAAAWARLEDELPDSLAPVVIHAGLAALKRSAPRYDED